MEVKILKAPTLSFTTREIKVGKKYKVLHERRCVMTNKTHYLIEDKNRKPLTMYSTEVEVVK